MKRNQSTPRIIILLLFLCILFCSCGKAKPASSESALDAARAKEAERNAEREKEEQEEAQREHHKKLAEGNVELSEYQFPSYGTISGCCFQSDQKHITLDLEIPDIPKSDDAFIYLFAFETYDSDHKFDSMPVTSSEKATTCHLTWEYEEGQLFQEFVPALLVEGEYVPISTGSYITNPEMIASNQDSRLEVNSKKGLLIDPETLETPLLEDLGVKHAIYNIPLSIILGETSNPACPTIYYDYRGKTYQFNGAAINGYDYLFSYLTSMDMISTAIILNDRSAYSNALIHPNARGGGGQSNYYAFNNTDKDGIDAMAAVATFLANRYAGTGHGKVMNWVIGNEVNVRQYWNYIAQTDVKTYSDIYADSLRVFYNGIKSKNKNARVYISLDQVWHQNNSGKICYDGRDMLDEVNRYLKEEGNIDWCVAFHPYNYPLPATKAWADNKKVTNSVDTQIITMKNIDVLTNYLQNEAFLNSKGEVRRVSLSELGYTSSGGQEIQAASYAYCYKKAERNPYIDNVLLNRQTDHPVEVAEGLALGLDTSGGGHKMIYNVFKHIDGAQSDSVTKFARDLIGISSWSQLR